MINHLYTKEISETDVIGFEFNFMKFNSIQKKVDSNSLKLYEAQKR